MKILVVTNLYPPNSLGGYERLCATLANALAERGHAVRVLTSAHGGGKTAPDPIPVDRMLRLLASSRSIYEPFEGGTAEREVVIEENGAVLRRCVEGFRPETILAGNLMFLDRRFLESLVGLGVRVAYLLTDVWLMQMIDDVWLQQYFKREVLSPEAGDLTGVSEGPADVLLAARAPVAQAEEARRVEIERRLANGRTAFQFSGTCHLCGGTVFLVRRPTPGTLALPTSLRTSVTCGRCGLDGAARAVLHAADTLVPANAAQGVGILAPDPEIAGPVGLRHPGPVASRVEDLVRAPEVKVVADLTDPLEGDTAPGSRKASLRPDQRILFSHRPGPSEQRGVGSYEIWSERYGYLGRDYRVAVWPPL
jgi:hypothetical protein